MDYTRFEPDLNKSIWHNIFALNGSHDIRRGLTFLLWICSFFMTHYLLKCAVNPSYLPAAGMRTKTTFGWDWSVASYDGWVKDVVQYVLVRWLRLGHAMLSEGGSELVVTVSSHVGLIDALGFGDIELA
ncbi:hypothetical protein EK21DRAFT_86276 [Setomelanomma holmii]|uniref:Uncharacterized protein n=1 Tax=Setomelanomma holmii TaxID=210430 RepID=A0A9P4LR78_9PLEO|nr:hypothetical protein EK21DRAFT_86276 [Setomelanomma holmii]